MRPRMLALGTAAVTAAIVLIVAVDQTNNDHHPATVTRPVSPPSPPSPPASPAPSHEQLGVSVNRLFNDGTFTQAQIDAQLAVMARTGATLARSDALWEATEPTAPAAGVHRYDWSFDDHVVGSLASHGLQWLPIIDYSAPWAQSIPGQDHSAPASDADYAAYAGALASRYGAGGSFWRAHPDLHARPPGTFEIWNEPDNPVFWSGGADPARYASLYIAARAAIKQVDPAARVIVGGLTAPATFLAGMLAAQPALRLQIDGIGIHPYGRNPFAVVASVERARRALLTLGLRGTPLYATEFGWTTSPPGARDYAPAAVRGPYIEAALAALARLDCGLGAAILYTWVTPQRDPGNSEDWFGINPPSGAPSRDVLAFAAGLRSAEHARDRVVCGSGG